MSTNLSEFVSKQVLSSINSKQLQTIIKKKEFDQILRTFQKIMTLQDTYRTGWKDRELPFKITENDSQHTYTVSILNLLSRAAFKQSLESQLIGLKEGLVHEFGESSPGIKGTDWTPFSSIKQDEKHSKEKKIVISTLSELPIKSRKSVFQYWKDFEDPKLGVFSKQIDKLETYLRSQILLTSKEHWLSKKITSTPRLIGKTISEGLDEFEDYTEEKMISEELKNLFYNAKNSFNQLKTGIPSEEVIKQMNSVIKSYLVYEKFKFINTDNTDRPNEKVADILFARTVLAFLINEEFEIFNDNDLLRAGLNPEIGLRPTYSKIVIDHPFFKHNLKDEYQTLSVPNNSKEIIIIKDLEKMTHIIPKYVK